MLVVRPNILSYNTVINSWAKSMHSDSAIRAQKLLTRMITTYKTEAFSTMKPDVVSFSSVLNALAKSKTVKFKGESVSLANRWRCSWLCQPLPYH